jgi:hypothetical protein
VGRTYQIVDPMSEGMSNVWCAVDVVDEDQWFVVKEPSRHDDPLRG